MNTRNATAEVTSRPSGAGEMGSIADVVTVAVGSGGVLAIVVGKLYDWVVLRRDAGSLKLKFAGLTGAHWRSRWTGPRTARS